MIDPPIDSLLEKVDNIFTLCVLVGKRARLLTNGAQKLTKSNSHKAVSIAINEINENKVTYIKTKEITK